jgi:hypothetical protein
MVARTKKMRIGLSPTRHQLTDHRPAQVTVCVLAHIPAQIGYYAHRFDVLKLSLQSIIKNTEGRYDLLVFDNGSCPEVVSYLCSLRNQGSVQYLMLSTQNIGIYGALKMMFHAAPGEIVAYSQDDVLFYPGWLKEHLKILDTFPHVGMVSGVPVREQFRYGNNYLASYLADFPKISVSRGRFIPDEWEVDFFVSTGRDAHTSMRESQVYEDIILEYHGLKAYSTAVHFQYVARKAVILQALTTDWEPRLMEGPDSEIDERIDALGYARLSTLGRYVRHIGNLVTADFGQSIAELGLTGEIEIWKPPKPLFSRLAKLKIIRPILQCVNNWSYLMLNYRPLT